MENHQLDVDVWLLHSNTKPAMSICAVCAHCFRNRQQQYNDDDDDCRDEDDEDTIPLNETSNTNTNRPAIEWCGYSGRRQEEETESCYYFHNALTHVRIATPMHKYHFVVEIVVILVLISQRHRRRRHCLHNTFASLSTAICLTIQPKTIHRAPSLSRSHCIVLIC